jgi:hypothetical protein
MCFVGSTFIKVMNVNFQPRTVLKNLEKQLILKSESKNCIILPNDTLLDILFDSLLKSCDSE